MPHALGIAEKRLSSVPVKRNARKRGSFYENASNHGRDIRERAGGQANGTGSGRHRPRSAKW